MLPSIPSDEFLMCISMVRGTVLSEACFLTKDAICTIHESTTTYFVWTFPPWKCQLIKKQIRIFVNFLRQVSTMFPRYLCVFFFCPNCQFLTNRSTLIRKSQDSNFETDTMTTSRRNLRKINQVSKSKIAACRKQSEVRETKNPRLLRASSFSNFPRRRKKKKKRKKETEILSA